jgi:dipeptidyl aminopeptidase/acylaminoacyl peptidase
VLNGGRLASFDAAGWAEFAASDGMLAYYTYPPTSFSGFDRGGRQGAAVIALGSYDNYRLAPDGRRVAFSASDAHTGLSDLWIDEFARNSITRVTADQGDHGDAVWSPDGSRLAFFGFHGLRKSTLSMKRLAEQKPALGLRQAGCHGRRVASRWLQAQGRP